MADKIRLGLIGASVRGTWSARSHLPAVRASSDFELAAVCTTRADSAEAARQAWGARLAFDDYRKMIASPEIEAVAVVVRVPSHLAPAKAALEASVRYLSYDLGKNNIRVNAISAGPIKTLAARGISGFGEMLKGQAERAPLKRNVDVNEVAATAVFLASDAGSGITGETIYVDCGYNIMGF